MRAMTPQCGRSLVQVLFVRVDIGVVIYEAMTTQCRRSVFQILVVRIGYRSGDLCSYDTAVWVVTASVAVQSDIGVVIYEAMTPQCRRSEVHVLVVRVDIEVVIYEATTHQCGRSEVHVLVVRGSGPGCQSGYRSGDL